jgi:hypothetical protein
MEFFKKPPKEEVLNSSFIKGCNSEENFDETVRLIADLIKKNRERCGCDLFAENTTIPIKT